MALDLLEIKRAVQIAKEAVEGGVDWIEAGTPLIKSEGMNAVRQLKSAFPKNVIVADMKTVDTGAMEVEMAAKAGADVVMLMGNADDSTIVESIRSARKYGVKVMVDLISVDDPLQRSKELESLGVDYINVHTGIDQQMMGIEPVSILQNICREVNVPVAVAGGLDPRSAARAVNAGADIVIVGGNIIRSDSVTESARAIRNLVDSPVDVTESEISRDEGIREILMSVSTPNISDAMHRKGAMKGIHSFAKGRKMVGTAVTVRTMEGDWAKTVEAIDTAESGDVIVIYSGSNDTACWGGLATMSCINKGVAGVVVDGAVRDIDEIKKMVLPVFAGNNVPNAGDPKGFGEINSEIVCGDQTVCPGDYIVGDDNGVVIVPANRAYEIARRAKEVEKAEKRLYAEIQKGGTLSDILQLEKWEKHR